MKKILINLILLSQLLTCACATKLNSVQQAELLAYEDKGLLVKEKSPSVAVALGFLPGFGAFYTDDYAIGVAHFILWPLSIFWAPTSSYNAANSINYYATKSLAEERLKTELTLIENELISDNLTKIEYFKKKREIEARYLPD